MIPLDYRKIEEWSLFDQIRIHKILSRILKEKSSSKRKTREEIDKAIEDSEKYFKKVFPEQELKGPLISIEKFAEGIKALAVANEVCTLKWVIGKGKLNCYGENEKN